MQLLLKQLLISRLPHDSSKLLGARTAALTYFLQWVASFDVMQCTAAMQEQHHSQASPAIALRTALQLCTWQCSAASHPW